MISVSFDPVYLEVGAPALALGVVLGALIAWLLKRGINNITPHH